VSFVIFAHHFERLFDSLRQQLASGGDMITEERRGNAWPDLFVPSHLQIGLPFQTAIYGDKSEILRFARRKASGSDPKIEEPHQHAYEKARGVVYHDFVLGTIENAKNAISHANQTKTLDLVRTLRRKRASLIEKRGRTIQGLSPRLRKSIRISSSKVLEFETLLVNACVNYWIACKPNMSLTSILHSALPVIVDHKITFPQMGLAGDITPDFVFPQWHAVGELKTGKPDARHKLALAAYSLAYEKQHNQNIDFGVILYLDVPGAKTPTYKIDAFVVSDVYRSSFLELRNDRLKLVRKEMERLAKQKKGTIKSKDTGLQS